MLKVLIVDDSAYFRTELKTMIDWEKHGFRISGEANNGQSALQLMRTDLPDIVITDMNMPVVNGIDLIDNARRSYPHMKIVTVSAYNDFELVRQSMKNGSLDYVLKHRLTEESLLETLEAAREAIADERKKQAERYGDSVAGMEARRQQFLTGLLEGGETDHESVRTQLAQLEIRLDPGRLFVAIAEIDDFSMLKERFAAKELEVLIRTMVDIVREIVKEWNGSVVVRLSEGRFAIICPLGQTVSQLNIYHQQFDLLHRLKTQIKKFTNATVSLGVSAVCDSMLELPAGYRQAAALLEEKFHKGKDKIYIDGPASRQQSGFFSLDIRDEKEMYNALTSLDAKRVQRQLEETFARISDLKLNRKSTQMICIELLHIVNKAARDCGIDAKALYGREDAPYDILVKYETLQEIRAWMTGICFKLVERVSPAPIAASAGDVTKKAVQYIRQNYRRNLSLADAAEYAGVSSSYLSRLFKEECGFGFAEYLNRVRVEEAKRLIERGEGKIKDMVHRVGFNNYNYFFKVFKEAVGMTPLEYEQSLRNGQPGPGQANPTIF